MPSLCGASGGFAETAGAVPASSIGTTVTASATANTKGSAVELIASTAHDAHWVSVTIVAVAMGSGGTGLLDILIGASTEAVLIPDLPVNSRAANEGGGGQYLFPIFIPKGSRLSARQQGSTSSATADVIVHLFGGDPLGPYAGCTYVDRYGATTTSRGTNIDPGVVLDTFSAWSAAAFTMLRPVRWLVVAFQNIDIGFTLTTQWTIQVGIGAATEQTIAGDFLLTAGTVSDNAMPYLHFYLPIFISSGSVVSVRAKCNSVVDGDRDLYLSLFGAG